MRIIQEPNKVALWNKRHFEEKKTEIMQHFKNIQYVYLLNKYLKCSVWRLALRYDIYIYMSLGFKRLILHISFTWIERLKKIRNFLRERKRKKAKLIGHFLRRNYLLKHVIEEKIEGSVESRGKRGGRRQQLLDDLKKRENTGIWKTKT